MTDHEASSPTPPAGAALGAQLRRHSVALISLAVAIISLSYNTWRNETSEYHRNLREAGFRVLMTLGELQEIIDYTAYFHTQAEDVPSATQPGLLWTAGWGKAAMVRDLTSLMPAAATVQGQRLFTLWSSHADALLDGVQQQQGREAEQQLSAQVSQTRQAVLTMLQDLR
ncbi:MAG: hypothetical protein Tsb002_19460 [Wenzhouxiangellaceae bacterium]